jgi:hypothetical protein
MPCLIGFCQGTLTASLGLLATPVLLWQGQSLPAATAPAPGPHTSSKLMTLSSRFASVGLFRIASGPFPSQVEPPWVRSASARTCCGSFSASRLPGSPYEPLYAISNAAVAQRRTMVSSRPLSPSGGLRAPWAPSTCPRLPRPSARPVTGGDLSLAQARWAFRRLSPVPRPSISSSRNPEL